MKYYIYTLSEPDTKEIRYIGKSSNPQTRYYNHLWEKTKSHKSSWISSLKSRKLKPILNIIAEFDDEKQCYESEIYYISEYTTNGCDLVNHQIGGQGATSSSAIGSNNGNSKIDEDIVLSIRDQLLFTGYSIETIASNHNVSQAIVNNIKYANSWQHITNFTGEEVWIREESITNRAKSLKDKGIYDKLSIKVDQYDLEGNFIQSFKSISEAARITNSDRSGINQSINNINKKTNNFIWKRNVE